MRTARASDIPFEQFSRHREGEILFCRLLQGQSASPDNFELSLVRTVGDYYTPRHRHNFDQVRLTVEGTFNYARGKDAPSGRVVYYPEGAPYGPQEVNGDPLILLLQAGGAAGHGFLTYDEISRGYTELASEGEFRNGTYHGTDPATGKARNQDGYEAVWERITGSPVSYPAPRYAEPVDMDPDNFDWIDVDGEPGVACKLLGVFSERSLSLAFLHLDPGARHTVQEPKSPLLHFVVRGRVRVGGEDLGAHDAFMFEPGDGASTFEAIEDSEVFTLGLPVFAPVRVPAAV
jgi:hypothetical protein